jgi:hypothetical protein
VVSGAWTPEKVAAVRAAFFEFLRHVYINSKNKGGNYCLADGVYDAQHRLLNAVFDGLADDIHDFKALKSRQLGITTIIEAFIVFYLGVTSGIQGAAILDTASHLKAARLRIKNIIKNLPKSLKYPAIVEDSRDMLVLANGSKISWMAAGVRETESSGGLGRSEGFNLVWGSEVSSWRNEEGIVSLIETLSETFPDRLYLWESTARGYNQWRDMWLEAQEDTFHQRTIFIGWWAHPDHVILKTDRRFAKYGSAEPTDEERTNIEKVRERYHHDITIEQLAWHRYKIDPTREAEESEKKGGQFKQQEQPTCVTADTRVGTNLGLIPITQIVPGMTTALGRVVRAGPTGTSEIWRVETLSGFRFRGTPDHPLIDENGNELEIQNSLGKRVRLQQPKLSDELATVRWRDGVIEGCISITPELARFVGIFMGDGSASGRRTQGTVQVSICCDAKDRDFIAQCVTLFKSLFGVTASESSYNTDNGTGWVAVRTAQRVVYEALNRMGLLRYDIGKTMRHVHVPEFIFRSPKHVVAEFLKGLFETDGFVAETGNRVAIFSKWPEFLRDVQYLLLAFGITSRCKRMKKKSTLGHFYTGNQLELRTIEANKFIQEIGFISSRKITRSTAVRNIRPRARKPIEFVDTIVVAENTGVIETVYNLTVEGRHWFDAYGILTHNTEEECFTASGTTFFDYRALNDQALRITAQGKSKNFQYRFGNEFPSTIISPAIFFRDVQLRVWEEPQAGATYIVSGDPAYGRNPDNDRSAVQVLKCFADCIEQVAEFASPEVNTTQFAWVLMSLAAWYGNSGTGLTLIVELDGPGEAVWKEIDTLPSALRSPYLRQQASDRGLLDVFQNVRNFIFNRPDSMAGRGNNWQWKTGNRKEAIMEQTKALVATTSLLLRSMDLVEEMRKIARDGAAIEAPSHKHDDRVMALAIGVRAWYDEVRRPLMAKGITRQGFLDAQKMTTQGRYDIYMRNQLSSMFHQKASIARMAAREARRAQISRRR